MSPNQKSGAAEIVWTVEQNRDSKLLLGWGKSSLDRDAEGREVGLRVFKVGFVDEDTDFKLKGSKSFDKSFFHAPAFASCTAVLNIGD